jgi:hypothetical protein
VFSNGQHAMQWERKAHHWPFQIPFAGMTCLALRFPECFFNVSHFGYRDFFLVSKVVQVIHLTKSYRLSTPLTHSAHGNLAAHVSWKHHVTLYFCLSCDLIHSNTSGSTLSPWSSQNSTRLVSLVRSCSNGPLFAGAMKSTTLLAGGTPNRVGVMSLTVRFERLCCSG